MATLVNKVRAITRSTTGLTTNNQVVEFLKDSISMVIASIPKELLRAYSTNGSVTSSTGIDVGNNTILEARRGNYVAKQVDKKEAGWIEAGSGSYLVPTAEFPKWYERNGIVYIKPNPTTSVTGYAEYIAIPSISTGSSNVFGVLENIVIYEAASQDFQSLAGYYATSTAITGKSMAYWLEDEDSEMVQTAAQLVQHFNTKSAEYHNKAIQAIELHIKNSSEMIAVQSRGQ